MAVRHTRFGPLSCHLVDRLPDGTQPALSLVLCHGFGAPGDDLVPLADALLADPRLAKVRCIFPEAPLSLGGMGFGARAWWMIDVGRIDRAMREGRLLELVNEEPDGLAAARRKLRACLEALLAASGHDWERLVLGGFSQGAMLSTDVALRAEEAPAGLAILSGTVLCESLWRKRAARRAGMPIVQSHGRADPLLPFTLAERLRELLREAGLTVGFHAFGGGHTIPPEVLPALADLVADRLG